MHRRYNSHRSEVTEVRSQKWGHRSETILGRTERLSEWRQQRQPANPKVASSLINIESETFANCQVQAGPNSFIFFVFFALFFVSRHIIGTSGTRRFAPQTAQTVMLRNAFWVCADDHRCFELHSKIFKYVERYLRYAKVNIPRWIQTEECL